ncbi:TPA: DUF2590 family protein [Yersinia enterocolitica]|uniref:DUF2590 family protein n=1 Tax=Yersinia TaxID=629 RepID=UPI0005EA32D4|nr:DUF2590 family protein [Yersinia enterocolitica]EKN4865422.1 DUF2590 family protein [Yersinia enterocolitica]ELI7915169.1 DUF2590 family protein [Yersinia enterocolitica]ELI7927403.1 DUF2590 family protein [Yersinia enterocolitica]ELI7958022.1 DUF2590 family protein [Yersinia enterocolitica]ELI8139938.1 DUF2590 family protein [Yersinia enterocolitica]
MSEQLYIDLLITDGDFTLSSGNEPLLCDNRISIAQDCVHRIIESGLVKLLIAERSPVLRTDILLQMELLTETDTRIVPGTVLITDDDQGHYFITADTYDFGPLSLRDLL